MPGEVRRRRPRQETPSTKIATASIATPRQAPDNEARLVALIKKQLDPRCHDCGRQLHALRSILLGVGPICWAKRRSGGVS
jgi:ribosomal protein L34E